METPTYQNPLKCRSKVFMLSWGGCSDMSISKCNNNFDLCSTFHNTQGHLTKQNNRNNRQKPWGTSLAPQSKSKQKFFERWLDWVQDGGVAWLRGLGGGGGLFQRMGAATLKALSPKVHKLVRRTTIRPNGPKDGVWWWRRSETYWQGVGSCDQFTSSKDGAVRMDRGWIEEK